MLFLHNLRIFKKICGIPNFFGIWVAFCGSPMPINIVMLSPHLSVNPVEAQAASNPEWGLAAGFSSQTLLFTDLTHWPPAFHLTSSQLSLPSQTSQSCSRLIRLLPPAGQVTFHVTLFPQRDSFMTPFQCWSREDA